MESAASEVRHRPVPTAAGGCAIEGQVPDDRPARRLSRLLAGCVAGVVMTGTAACAGATPPLVPLEDPVATARRAELETAPERPYHVTLSWEYADERGAVEGDGVLRYTPPDSLRLDLLLASGDGSMAAALVAGSELRVSGSIENVRLPPPPFLYASAGLLRPGPGRSPEAYRAPDGETILVYPARDGSSLRVRIRDGRLLEVEERVDGRAVRRTRLRWPDSAAAWPSEAEYRDRALDRRARWTLLEARAVKDAFPPGLYDLPPSG